MANAPIKRFAVGNGIRASVWKNESKKHGAWLSVTITRTCRDGEDFKDTTTFRRLTRLLSHVIRAIRQMLIHPGEH